MRHPGRAFSQQLSLNQPKKTHLARAKIDLVLVVHANCIALAGHVSSLHYVLAASLDQGFSVGGVNLILGSTGQGDVNLGVGLPGALAIEELSCTGEGSIALNGRTEQTLQTQKATPVLWPVRRTCC